MSPIPNCLGRIAQYFNPNAPFLNQIAQCSGRIAMCPTIGYSSLFDVTTVLNRIQHALRLAHRLSSIAHSLSRIDHGLSRIDRGLSRIDHGLRCIDHGLSRIDN